jgi:hypothetical protein
MWARGSLDVSQHYGSPRPVTEMALYTLYHRRLPLTTLPSKRNRPLLGTALFVEVSVPLSSLSYHLRSFIQGYGVHKLLKLNKNRYSRFRENRHFV